MRDITLEELLEAGCHFGHQVNRNNPKAMEFIFEARNNVHIINLENTREGLLAAAERVKNIASEGKSMVIVGTKRQVQPVVKEEALRAREQGAKNIHFVTARWIGGMITNFHEVSKNFKRLNEIEEILKNKNSDYTKRERLLLEREKEKLMNFYEGVRDLKNIPDALFIIDTHHESTAVHEASRLGVEVIGVVDTNADPTIIDYPIPSNDDAVGAVKIITSFILDAWLEGQKEAEKSKSENEASDKENSEDVKSTKTRVVASDESSVTDEVIEQTQNKEAVRSATTSSRAKSDRMDTKPAVDSPNRAKTTKKEKEVAS